MPEAPRHVLISSVKDEGPFILEWVAHHQVLGFDRICIASNDCRDGSDRLLDALDRAGAIHHVENPVGPEDRPQHKGYDRIRAAGLIRGAEWLMMLDCDEFLNVHVGGHRVADLTARAGKEVDVIALNGMCFTGAPEVNWRPGPVCPRYTTRIASGHKANAPYKTLTRHPRRFGGIHNHSMVKYRGDTPLTAMNAAGERWELDLDVPLWKQLRTGPRNAISHRLAQYNHYCIKTWDSFNLRRDRGIGARSEAAEERKRYTEDYFHERSIGVAEDLTIARYQAEVAARMAELLSDPLIRQRQEEAEALYGELCAPYRRAG